MKLAVETFVLRGKFGDMRGLELAAEAGFDGVDYSYYWGGDQDPSVGEGYLDYAAQLRQKLDSLGLTCHQAHAPFDFQYGMAMDETEPQFVKICRSIESSAVLGVQQIIVHSIQVPEGEDVLEYNRRFYKALEPIAARVGVQIAVENLFQRIPGGFAGRFGTPEALLQMIRLLDSPWFVACIDVGHASLTGVEPEVFLRGMGKGVVKALHIQDNDYKDDRHVPPYSGMLHWDEITAALREIEYDGEMTLEIFGFLGKLPPALFPQGLKYAECVGRHLIKMVEE